MYVGSSARASVPGKTISCVNKSYITDHDLTHFVLMAFMHDLSCIHEIQL